MLICPPASPLVAGPKAKGVMSIIVCHAVSDCTLRVSKGYNGDGNGKCSVESICTHYELFGQSNEQNIAGMRYG